MQGASSSDVIIWNRCVHCLYGRLWSIAAAAGSVNGRCWVSGVLKQDLCHRGTRWRASIEVFVGRSTTVKSTWCHRMLDALIHTRSLAYYTCDVCIRVSQ